MRQSSRQLPFGNFSFSPSSFHWPLSVLRQSLPLSFCSLSSPFRKPSFNLSLRQPTVSRHLPASFRQLPSVSRHPPTSFRQPPSAHLLPSAAIYSPPSVSFLPSTFFHQLPSVSFLLSALMLGWAISLETAKPPPSPPPAFPRPRRVIFHANNIVLHWHVR